MDLKLTVDGLEKERDFYFSKLRDIELICQEHESENSPVISGIIGILYATEVSSAFTRQCPRPPGSSPSGLALRREEAGPERTLENMDAEDSELQSQPQVTERISEERRTRTLVPKLPACLAHPPLPSPLQEGFAPPEDDEIEEHQQEDQDEY